MILSSRRAWRMALCGLLSFAVQSWMPALAQVQSQFKLGDEIAALGLVDDDLFGYSVCSVGDIDNDGVEDIVVGLPRGDEGGGDTGGIWVIFLNIDGSLKGAQEINDTWGFFFGTLDNSDYFGSSVCNMGDLNGDGVNDIAVGAPGDDDGTGGAKDRGAVWILFLKDNGTCDSYQKISDTVGSFAGVLGDADLFGQSVAKLNDLDRDGVQDLVVGAPGDDDGTGDNAGAVWILFMKTDGTVKNYIKIGNTTTGFAGTLQPEDGFGHSVCVMGDMDLDGHEDIVVGAIRDDQAGPDRGAVYVIQLTVLGGVKYHRKIGGTAMWPYLDDFDMFGSAVAPIGDLNGDGRPDLAVGASGDDDLGPSSGAIYLIYMWRNGDPQEIVKVNSGAAPFTGSIEALDYFGCSLGMLPDLNGDGVTDLLVGAMGDDGGSSGGGIETGAAYVVQLGFRVPAGAIPRNGTGINRECFVNQSLPQSGTSWNSYIDATVTHPPQSPTFVFAYDKPHPGFMTPFGELLISTEPWGGVKLFSEAKVSSLFGIATYSFPVPSDIALEGFTLSTQGMIYSSFVELCNAIDLTVGM